VIAAWRDAIDLDHVAAMRAVIVLTPLILLAMISGDGIWLRAALVTISTFIAMERSGLAPLGTLLHGVAIIGSYLALLAAQTAEPLFVAGCLRRPPSSLRDGMRGYGRWAISPSFRRSTLRARLRSGEGRAIHCIAAFTFFPPWC
jgi:hypothetical protein